MKWVRNLFDRWHHWRNPVLRYAPPFPDGRRNMLYPFVVTTIKRMVIDGKIPPFERLDPMPKGRDDLAVRLTFAEASIMVGIVLPADGYDVPAKLIEDRVLHALHAA